MYAILAILVLFFSIVILCNKYEDFFDHKEYRNCVICILENLAKYNSGCANKDDFSREFLASYRPHYIAAAFTLLEQKQLLRRLNSCDAETDESQFAQAGKVCYQVTQRGMDETVPLDRKDFDIWAGDYMRVIAFQLEQHARVLSLK